MAMNRAVARTTCRIAAMFGVAGLKSILLLGAAW
jgi:hypothetical protein